MRTKDTRPHPQSDQPTLRGISVLLSAALLITLFAGCGSGANRGSAESSAASKIATDDASVPAHETEPSASEAETADYSISYPLEDRQTFTYFYSFNANSFGNFMNDWNDNKMLPTVNAATGITLEFMSPSSNAENEQFSLMIASGDYADFMNIVDFYDGGVETALEQDVIVDLTDYIETCAPDYWDKVCSSNEATRRTVVTDEEQVLAVYGIMNTMIQDSGLLIRKDWLDALGLDIPETTDELYQAMMEIKSAYNPDNVLDMNSSTNLQYIVGGFDISGISLSGGMFAATDLGVYIGEDGTSAVSTLQSDGYREYIEYLIQLYQNDLIDQDFYSQDGFGASATDIAVGSCAIIRARSDVLPTVYSSAEDDSVEVAAMSGIVGEKGDTYEFGDIPELTAKNKVSISSQCADVETALKYLNWFFTDDAYLICNYGEEGVSFEYDEDGVPTYTELLTNNEASNLANIRYLYCFMCLPMYVAQDAMYHSASEIENEACETWGQMGYSRTMPTLTYTAEEAATRGLYMTDIISRAAEVVTAWIIGQAPLNDKTWMAFQGELEGLGIDEVMACEQAAFDRYLSR